MAGSARIPGFTSEAARAEFLTTYDRALQRLWPVPVRAEDIPTRYGTVRIYRAGPEGSDPYVLLTGAGGNALAWYRWMHRLADRPVIAVDPLGEPGHSVQTAPVRGREEAAAWVEELLAGAGADRAHLVGVSWGGYLALEHEVRHPGRVAAITLVDSAGLGPLGWRFWLWLIIGGLAALLLPGPLRRWAARRLRNTTLAEDELIPVLRASMGYRRPVTRTPVLTDDELAAVGVPVQVLFGGRSPLRGAAERLPVVVPHWRVEIIADAGHALVMDAEDDVIERVLCFAPADPAGGNPPEPAAGHAGSA
jgi:pimeloyl-ACP methyl ester carboxylesterase